MNIISKKEAKNKGLKYYYTGKPCKYGHTVLRRVNDGVCYDCSVRMNANYRKTHKEHIKEYHKKRNKKLYTTEKRRKQYRKHIKMEILNRVKFRAKRDNIPFNITIEDINIPEYCPIFGTKIDVDDNQFAPSLDRKDNTKGYIKGNVFVISKKANRLKNNGTVDEFKKIIEYMLN